jgi:hypothetical protein
MGIPFYGVCKTFGEFYINFSPAGVRTFCDVDKDYNFGDATKQPLRTIFQVVGYTIFLTA